MHFQPPALALGFLATLSTAAPADLEARQGYFAAVGYKYTGGGCTDQTVTYADPIFGYGGYCQPLNRFPDASTPPITSYKLATLAEGCTVKVYSSADCTGTAYSATVGNCVQGNAPFVSAFVSCAWAGTRQVRK